MDFRTQESKSNPPANLPKAGEGSFRPSKNEDFLSEEVDFENDRSKSKREVLPSFGEEEIHLPKFVKQEPQKEEKKHYLEGAGRVPKNRKNILLLLIVVILALSYGVWQFWQRGIFFKKNQAKKEVITETKESDFGNIDEDGDGLSNSQELQYGTNPKEKDTDFDGLPDGFEVKYKLNPLDYVDALSDPDEDGLNNLEEYQYQTDPQNSDTDGDGYKDGEEVEHGYNPAGSGKLLPK
ncbi:MAG: hypothetical protein AB1465_01550 [Patescibacteria group bacterium]